MTSILAPPPAPSCVLAKSQTAVLNKTCGCVRDRVGGAAKQESLSEPLLNGCTATSETFAGGHLGQQTTGPHRFSAFWLRQRSPPIGCKVLA